MRQNPHVRICGGPGSATTLVYPTGAGHPVDRVHRSRVPGGNPRFSPKISEVKATDQQRPAQAPGNGQTQASGREPTRIRPRHELTSATTRVYLNRGTRNDE